MERDIEISGKIGLFGGTFNPVHLGHLRSAEEIREEFNLAKVIFVPAHMPPHKPDDIIPAEHRFEMVRLSVQGDPFFGVSDIELKRKGNSYSFETIDHFNTMLNRDGSGNRDAGGGKPPAQSELFFIMGLDAFKEIHTWKKYPDFFSSSNFIVMSRPGQHESTPEKLMPRDVLEDFSCTNRGRRYDHRSGKSVYFCDITHLDLSSTDIRKRLQEGKSIKYLVPDPAASYIKEHGLY